MDLVHTIHEPAGAGPHPTVLALHGWGANAFDLLGLAPYLAGGQFLMLCPQGRIEVPLGPMTGYGWFPLTMDTELNEATFAGGVADADKFLEAALQRYPINRSKLVVLGFSQGGVIAYALALQKPERFAALVALSSWLPEPVARLSSSAGRGGPLTLIHHGSRDELIPVARGRESVERLRVMQAPVSFREFDMGHEITAASLNDVSEWLRDKVLSPIVLVR